MYSEYQVVFAVGFSDSADFFLILCSMSLV